MADFRRTVMMCGVRLRPSRVIGRGILGMTKDRLERLRDALQRQNRQSECKHESDDPRRQHQISLSDRRKRTQAEFGPSSNEPVQRLAARRHREAEPDLSMSGRASEPLTADRRSLICRFVISHYGLYDRTRGAAALSAMLEQMAKGPLHATQVFEPGPDLGKPCGRNLLDSSTVGTILEREQSSNLLQRKAQVLSTLDEAYPGHMVAVVSAIASNALCGLWNQTAALVISDGFNAHGRGLRGSADGDTRVIHGNPLDSVLESGL
jgi:hypothetical protein